MISSTASPVVTGPPPVDTARVQRRTLRLLAGTQVIGGIGITIGIAVGGLLAARLGGVTVSGLAQSAAVVGGALLAVPVVGIMNRYGRRPGLALAYLVGAAGGVLVVVAAGRRPGRGGVRRTAGAAWRVLRPADPAQTGGRAGTRRQRGRRAHRR